jgi:hypothetical protein
MDEQLELIMKNQRILARGLAEVERKLEYVELAVIKGISDANHAAGYDDGVVDFVKRGGDGLI